MTTPLSPAAQAVFSAWQGASDGHYSDGEWIPNVSGQLAAALRAAADQVATPIPDDCTADVFNRQIKIRAELLSIAAELEGADG
jgi:hypothetical protein